jgi:translation initiation factor 2-alpha kinase 3
LFEDSSAISSRGLSEPPASAPDGHDDNFALRRVGTKGTTATVSDADDTIETVDRTEPSFSMQSTSSVIKFSEPTLALHMQMSLHPMTLADFISPPEDVAGKAPSLRHCFHIGPSLSIIAAILDGIEYLHSEGIVHRDIKPANIFLGPHNNPRATNGSVDLMLCNDCRQEHAVNPIRLEIRIGDFGLVSVADPANEPSNVSAHVQPSNVGTEIYRPVTQEATLVPSALDIYALGIVLFELLCPFSTRMERLHIINKLKEGCYPDKFCNGSEGPAGIERCISAMLGSEGSDTTVAGIRAMIAALQK